MLGKAFRIYKRLAVTFFGKYSGSKAFRKIKPDLQASGTGLLPNAYASLTIFTTLISYFFSLAAVITTLLATGADWLSFILLGTSVPVFMAFFVFALFYFYPSQRAKSIRNSIDNDLPFAVSHMSAISSSGIPPEYMFELLSGFEEYRDVAKHSSLIVRNINAFGMSSVSSIKSVASSTPSATFKQILNGIAFNIEKGGNLQRYLKEMADKNLFDYRIKREKYLKTLSTYADIYTALLVAAPLMMLAVLAILSVIGGEIVGMTMPELITLLTFGVLPMMNIAFLAFIHLTYPGV